MKKKIAGVMLLCLLTACGNKKANINPFAYITNEVDSIRNRTDSVRPDTLSKDPIPIEEDGSFDDFIYTFASDDSLQLRRVKFPLSYYTETEKKQIEESNWKHDDLFTKQSFYTLLFDKEEDMELIGNPKLTSVQVEWILVKTRVMKRYYFERIKGAWMLEGIDQHAVERKENEDFIDFFARFSSDSLFQSRRVKKPLAFVTADPDDDFSILETRLDLNQWFAFKPELPTEKLSNINYGQRNNATSSTKVLVLRGIGNGFSNILYFHRKNGSWMLYKFEDSSV